MRRGWLRVAVLLGLLLLLANESLGGSAQVRVTTDLADDAVEPQVHFLYVVPRDGEDRAMDTNGAITRSVDLWQGWLRTQTGGRHFRLDTHQGLLDISFFRLATDDATVAARREFVREQIEEEIFAAGYNSPSKIYAVYYDGSSTWSCGGGDPQPSFRGSVAAMYLKGTPPGAPPCASNPLGVRLGFLEFGMLHEIVHNLGFVPRCARNARGDYDAGHVSDSPFDLMWAGDAPWGTNVPAQMQLDLGRDDYYGHGRADCPDLSASPYLMNEVVSAPPVQAPSASPKTSPRATVSSFTTSPVARAGEVFRAALTVSTLVQRAQCNARLGRRVLTPTKAVGDRVIRCSWRLPITARGLRLRGSVLAVTEAGVLSRAFVKRAR